MYDEEDKIYKKEITEEYNNIRPLTFDEFIGQETLKVQLKIAIRAAKERGDPAPHMLFGSQPGRGKTSLAQVVANEYGSELKIIMCPTISGVPDILEVLVKLKRNSIVLFDELQSLNDKVIEALYSPMEDFKATIRTAGKNIVHIPISKFCMIGATTEIGSIAEPLRNRFGIVYHLDEYTDEELAKIVLMNVSKVNIKLDDNNLAIDIARRARGTPRIVNMILCRIRDYVQLFNNGIVTKAAVDSVMELLGIDERGLTKVDIEYLNSLYRNFAGSAGIYALSSTLPVDKTYIEQYIEPMLIKNKLIVKTRSGRVITEDGLKYIVENK